MIMADRRKLLRLAALAALAPALAPRPARALGSKHFVPPSGPMRYTRQLRREMAGGFALMVSRSFAIRFTTDGTGYRVDGSQVDVAVEAPAKLAQFAELERQRQETGLFPLALNALGRIQGGGGTINSTQLDAAMREVTAQFDRAAIASDERAQLDRFVNAVHQGATSLVTELPDDLFAPESAERTATRPVSLPGGDAGAVTVRFTAQTDPGTGLMKQARREVVTDLSGDQRRTVEDWTLLPI